MQTLPPPSRTSARPRAALLALSLAALGAGATAQGATINKVAKNKNQMMLKLTKDELTQFTPGMKVLIEVSQPSLAIAGEIMSLSGSEARVWLDGRYPELRAKAAVTLSVREGGAGGGGGAGITAVRSGTYPGRSVISFSKYYMNPMATYGSSEASPSNSDLIEEPFLLGQYMRMGWFYTFNQFQLGPELAYFSQTRTTKGVLGPADEDDPGEEVEYDTEAKLTAMELNLTGRFFFRPYAAQSINPYGALGFGYGTSTIKIGDAEPATGKRTILRVALGASYFMTAGFTADFGLEYRRDGINTVTYDVTKTTTTDPTTGASTQSETVSKNQDATSLSTIGFIYGLSLYM